MLEALAQNVQSLAQARSMPDLREAVSHAIRALGFSSFLMSVNKSDAAEFVRDPTLTDWTAEALETYYREHWSEEDPMVRGTTRPDTPFLWRCEDWQPNLGNAFVGRLANAGLRGGVTIPLKGAPGTLGAMTLLAFSEDPLTEDGLQAARIIAAITVTRAAALGAGVIATDRDRRRLALLSPRQLEILRWVAQGKTNREIAMIMDSNRRTIDYHLQEILSKLEVSSRTQAATLFSAFDG